MSVSVSVRAAQSSKLVKVKVCVLQAYMDARVAQAHKHSAGQSWETCLFHVIVHHTQGYSVQITVQ